jgi:hypothetical protein
MTTRQRTGPYTLPLPAVPRRPAWMNGEGPEGACKKGSLPSLAKRLAAVKPIHGMTPAQRKADLAKRLSHDTEHETTGRVVRSGGMQWWDAKRGGWRACPNLRAVRIAFRQGKQSASNRAPCESESGG